MRRLAPFAALLAAVALAASALTPAAAQSSPIGQTFAAALDATSGATSSGGIALVASATGVRYRVRSLALASSSAGVVMVKSGNVQDSPRVALYLGANTTVQVGPDVLGSGVALDRGEALVLEIASGNVSGTVVYARD